MKELVEQIKAEYEVFAVNADAQIEKGNKAAGARARKAALNIMKMMKEFIIIHKRRKAGTVADCPCFFWDNEKRTAQMDCPA